MLRLTKIFHFEMAHAINGYNGVCKNIHGHSYELYVTISSSINAIDYIPSPGFVIDFKEIKMIVKNNIIDYLDHKMILSRDYLSQNPSFTLQENLLIWEVEPTAENMLIYIMKVLHKNLPGQLKLDHLKLYETKESYAEWINDNTFN